MKCIHLVFKKQTFISNKGSIIVIIYFSIYLIILIIFIFKGITSLKLICSQFEGYPQINPKEIKSNDNTIKTIKLKTINKNNNNMNNKIEDKKSVKKVKKRKSKNKINPPRKKETPNNNNKNNTKSLNEKIKRDNTIDKQLHSSYRNDLELKKNKEKNISIYTPQINEENDNNELSNYELNDLEYEDSIKLDKRKFLEIYWSIIKREHLILFTFFSKNDYNLLPIKCVRFIFLVCTDMAFNVFFFSDDTMNKIFLTYGKYDFIQKIPQMIYTLIVSQLLEVLLCFLSLTDKYIYEIKKLKNKSFDIINKIFRIIKIKLIIFCVITFILFIFYWHIISAFCAVNINTQNIFIKDSISSFAMGLIYPFILYLFPSGLRIICLKNKESNLKLLYILSDMIPIF